MDRIHTTLSEPAAMADLLRLYSMSQAEYTRNGKMTMEIGMSRERDLLAVLKMRLGDDIKVDLDNDLTEDCVVAGVPISIKHVSAAPGKGAVKAKWTSDATQATAYVDKMLKLELADYTDIVIIYIDLATKKITFFGLAAAAVLEGVRLLGRDAFVSRTGTNNRGVEYSPRLLKHLQVAPAFKLEQADVTLASGMDPIQRRIALLRALPPAAEV
jgi:hypothetical protein